MHLQPVVETFVGSFLFLRQSFHHAQGRRGSQTTLRLVSPQTLRQGLSNVPDPFESLQKGPAATGQDHGPHDHVFEIVLIQELGIFFRQVERFKKLLNSLQTLLCHVTSGKGFRERSGQVFFGLVIVVVVGCGCWWCCYCGGFGGAGFITRQRGTG